MPRKDEGGPVKVPPEREHLLRIPCDGDADQVAIADDTVGRIEIDPASAGQVYLHPRVRCASAQNPTGFHARNEDVPAHETSRQAQGAHRFDHKNSKVPAATPTAFKCFTGTLYPLLRAAFVDEFLLDSERYGAEQTHRSGSPGGIQELIHPAPHVIAGIVMGQRAAEIWQIVVRVVERKGLRIVL